MKKTALTSARTLMYCLNQFENATHEFSESSVSAAIEYEYPFTESFDEVLAGLRTVLENFIGNIGLLEEEK